jgi:hypothetical protein
VKKACDLGARAREREKLHILAHYYGEATGKLTRKTTCTNGGTRHALATRQLDNLGLNYNAVHQSYGEGENLEVDDSFHFQCGPIGNNHWRPVVPLTCWFS